MKIALVNTVMPFVQGGAEILIDDLEKELLARGYEVDRFGIPMWHDFRCFSVNLPVFSQTLRFDEYDAVIAFKYPAYCINHPNKILWIFHQFRQIYELWDTDYGFKDSGETRAMKSIIKNCDDKFIPSAKKIFAISEAAKRLYKYNGIKAEVLHCPQKDSSSYYVSGTGDYIFCPSRINEIKRQHLAIEALKYTKTDVKVVITGVSESEDYMAKMERTVKKYKLEDRVVIENRWIDNDKKKKLLAGALAVFYMPYKEDSCGFVTMEGFYSRKPVITCSDSGGVCDFIDERKNGFVTEPDPKEIAEIMDYLYLNRDAAAELGENAFKYITDKDISWEKTIYRLLS